MKICKVKLLVVAIFFSILTFIATDKTSIVITSVAGISFLGLAWAVKEE